jgi:hypothetical protein
MTVEVEQISICMEHGTPIFCPKARARKAAEARWGLKSREMYYA